MKICFLGAGAFGKALAKVAEYNGHEVSFYDPIVFPEIELDTATHGKDLIVYVAPSDKAAELLPNLDKETPLICASKGFLSLKPFEGFKNFSALAGAAFSEQVMDTLSDDIEDKPSLRLTASSELAETIFSTEQITIEYTKDTLGILLCGAMKNIYAIGAGAYYENQLQESCGPTTPTDPTDQNSSLSVILPYLETAAAETQKILEVNGADKNTLKLSCGVSDLVLTCTDNSRNFRFGRALITGAKEDTATIEGVSAINNLENYQEFKIPDSATLIKDIIEKVKNAVK